MKKNNLIDFSIKITVTLCLCLITTVMHANVSYHLLKIPAPTGPVNPSTPLPIPEGYTTFSLKNWFVLLDSLVKKKQFKVAAHAVKLALQRYPANKQLLLYQADIYTTLERYDWATRSLNHIFDTDPAEPKALKLLSVIQKNDKYHTRGLNKLVISSAPTLVSDQDAFWDYLTAIYSRRTRFGTVYAGTNFASRNRSSGEQYFIGAYPHLVGPIYAHVQYAHSESSLFPSNHYLFETYVPMKAGFRVSLGTRYDNIQLTNLTVLTGSIAKETGSYLVIFRPYYFSPQVGPEAVLYTLSLRRSFDTPDQYVQISGYAGRSPDLADLTSVGFFIIKTYGINALMQLHLYRGLFMQTGAGYAYEDFPTGLRREKWRYFFGLMCRF